MKIIITAFTPFGEDKYNSAYKVVSALDINLSNVEIKKLTLPVVYDKSIYEKLIIEHKPDILLLCGQAAGRKNVTVEYQGLNLMYANGPDNNGIVKMGEIICTDGDNSILSTIPTVSLVSNINRDNLKLSLSAGGYICNMALYSSLYYVNKYLLDTKVGFIHFPLFKGQRDDDIPSLDLKLMTEILTKIITYLINIK